MAMMRYSVDYGDRHKYIVSVESLTNPSGWYAAYLLDIAGTEPSEKITAHTRSDALDQALDFLDGKHPGLERNGPFVKVG